MSPLEVKYAKVYLRYMAKVFDLDRAKQIGVGNEALLTKEVKALKAKMLELRKAIKEKEI